MKNDPWFERAQAEMKEYWRYRRFFLREGFTPEVAAKVFLIGLIGHLDTYHLFFYVKRIPQGGTYLEIGCAKGGSVLCAYLASKFSGISIHFIGIDPKPAGDLYENTKSISCFEFIKSTSDAAKDKIVNESVDLLFIDGDHEYGQVKRDIKNYSPKVKVGGIILGHDYHYNDPKSGVKEAVDEMFGDNITVLHSAIWVTKKIGSDSYRSEQSPSLARIEK